MKIEKWLKIPSFPDYHVSNFGRVKRGDKILSHGYSIEGYHRYSLRFAGISYSRTVHALVLQAFIGDRPPKHDACHNDGNPDNNHLSNLRWDTRRNNCLDAIRHGTSNKGERHGNHKLSEKEVRNLLIKRNNGYTYEKLAHEFKIHKSHAHRIVNGVAWNHVRKSLGTTTETKLDKK